MSLKKYLNEIRADSVASEIGFYTPLATHIFGALLGYPPKHRIINKTGQHGIPDIRLYSQEDGSEWAVVEAKLDDDEIRNEDKRERIWRDQILEHGYIGPETFYVVLCAPRTFYVCDLDGALLECVHMEDGHLFDPHTSSRFPLTDTAIRERLHVISYGASLERKQFEAFREGILKSGHVPLATETLSELQAVFSYAIEKLHEYCRVRFREFRKEYLEIRGEVEGLEQRFQDLGSGAVKQRAKIRYNILTLRARHHLAFQIFEQDYDRFKHDQTYAGTQEEEAFEDIFCTNTAYVALSRLIFVRICEDVGLTTRKISNSGIAVWREFVQNIKEHYQDLLEVAYKDVAHIYSSLFESSVFDWFGQNNGVLHAILERILFRLNAFSFRDINRDLLGSMYEYFRPRIERRRLGEYYTPAEVVDYILAHTGINSDSDIMQKRILDPACGSFTFGVRAVSRLLQAGSNLSPENRIDLVRTCLRGQDINPFSVFLSHLSLLFALLETYLEEKRSNPNYEIKPMEVSLQNSLTMGIPETAEIGSLEEDRPVDSSDEAVSEFDYIVGNPPFVRNERLPKQDREVLNERFPDLSVRNTDLSVYFLYVAAKHWAKEGGIVGMVAPLAVANAQMSAYLRSALREYEIFELVSLEWCAKQVFPGADIVPMLIFLKKNKRTDRHKVRLVRGIQDTDDLKRCIGDEGFFQRRSSLLSFDEWADLSPFGDWCLDVSETDMPILKKLNSSQRLEVDAHCCFAIKAGNNSAFLRAAKGGKPKPGEVPFVKGQHIAAFQIATDTEEYADLGKISTAEDASIWSDLQFYRANQANPDTTGLGRFDYKTPLGLATGCPSDALCCLVPEVYVTLVAAIVDPLTVAANNSVVVVVPKKYSAHCLAAIINSRVSRYYAFLTLRAAILLRRRAHWFPRALKSLPAPKLSEKSAASLHNLAVEAAELSGSVLGSETEAYLVGIAKIEHFRKAGFIGLQLANSEKIINREDLAVAEIRTHEMIVGEQRLMAESPDVLTLVRVALLATDQDEFTSGDIENIPLPADATLRANLAGLIRNFAEDLQRTQDRVLAIVEEIDEIVADGLGLTASDHETIRRRCQEFPLSATVERPRFAWSLDRKRQARRIYRPGDRFK